MDYRWRRGKNGKRDFHTLYAGLRSDADCTDSQRKKSRNAHLPLRKLGIKHPAKSLMPELWSSDTIKRILINSHYTGCTVNFRTTKKSYKCKKKVWNDPSKWVTFENTQEAIIDKQTYDAVQKIREGRRRPTPMGEMNVLSGMVYCADCGKKMYLCRCSTTKQKEYSNCSSYRKQKKSTCTSHQITVKAIEEIVLIF